ncbi:MAG: fucose isomerase [Candidatus Lokiarchaeota archaeon]|nr:fucose isomerase [Candidatus Lokiarchaeota archaeon]
MKQLVKIGVLCFARKTFDFNAAFDIYKKIQTDLKRISQVEWRFIPELVIEEDEAIAAALELKSKNIDAVICISGTFHLGQLILQFDRILQKPLLLWGLYELPYDGGRIRLNSVCGLNLDASNLYKSGIHNFHYKIGPNIDEDWIDAIRVIKAFTSSKIGIIGHHASGFFNIDVDEPILFKETGVLLQQYELKQVWDAEVSDIDVNKRREQIKELFDISGISDDQINKVADLTAKFAAFMDKQGLHALAVRCWPEFAAEFGISPCASMSILQSEHYILGCEGDVLGLMSMLAQKAIGGETPFLTDFSQVDFEQNYALLWHCGVAACNLWDGKCVRSLDSYFAGGKGVTADFVMKPGKVSLLRIDSVGEEFRIFLQRAEGLPMQKELKGTYLKTRFKDNIRVVLDKIITNGIAHHIALSYGNFIRPFEILAKIKKWQIVQ